MNVIYNKGGHVVHIAVPIHKRDSWDAFHEAGELARKVGGTVQTVYSDVQPGSRMRVLDAEVGGLRVSLVGDEQAEETP